MKLLIFISKRRVQDGRKDLKINLRANNFFCCFLSLKLKSLKSSREIDICHITTLDSLPKKNLSLFPTNFRHCFKTSPSAQNIKASGLLSFYELTLKIGYFVTVYNKLYDVLQSDPVRSQNLRFFFATNVD